LVATKPKSLNKSGSPISIPWTLQQLREAIASDHPNRILVHDRDIAFTQALDTSIANLRLRVLKTPHRSPK